jgi:hypothetical protein
MRSRAIAKNGNGEQTAAGMLARDGRGALAARERDVETYSVGRSLARGAALPKAC